MTLTSAIFAAMAAGILIGLAAPQFALQLTPLTSIFLRLVQSIIAPLILGGLVTGIAGAGSGGGRAMGRIGLKSLALFQAITLIVLLLALGAGNWFRPGDGLHIRGASAAIDRRASPGSPSSNSPCRPASSTPWRKARCSSWSSSRRCLAPPARPWASALAPW